MTPRDALLITVCLWAIIVWAAVDLVPWIFSQID